MRVKYTVGLVLASFLLIQIAQCAPPLFETFSQKENTKSYPRHRLPENVVKPLEYELEIRPILDPGYGTQYTAPATISITVQCLTNTNVVTLHAKTLIINHATAKITEQGTNTEVAITGYSVDDEKDFYIMNLNSQLEANKNYTIYLEYVAPVSTTIEAGLYRSFYKANDGTIKNLAVTDFEPADARRVFPSFDEPQLKASWKISIIRLPSYHSLSNMKKINENETVPGLPGWLKDTFEASEPISTYLICFVVSDYTFEVATSGLYQHPVTIWGPPPLMERDGGKYSPDVSAKLLKHFEEYFNKPSALRKMDKISIPHYSAGAMENWGLNTYREARLLYIEGLTTIQDKVSMTNTISHEIVHQWFGNLVTMRWWDDLWLNEGFASFYSSVGVHAIGMTDYLLLESLVTGSVQNAMQADVLPSTHPIHHTVLTPTEIRVIFDTITYSKGASVIRMMNDFVTETVLMTALTNYLNTHEYNNAHQDDLFTAINAEASPAGVLPSGTTVKQIMDTWTLQSGFPLVKATMNHATLTCRFEQSKFVTGIPGGPTDEGETWIIPLTYTVKGESSGMKEKKWLTGSTAEYTVILGANDWVLVNPQHMGFYRVQHDERNLDLIIDQLLDDHTLIDESSRSALIDDNLNLAFNGYLPLEQALRLTTYLNKERNLIPWVSFVTNMASPYRLFGRTAGFTQFKKYILALMVEPLEAINIDPQPDEPIANATLLRNRLFEWTCNMGHVACITYAQEKFRVWAVTPEQTELILPDLQPSVYCTAVANGGDAEFNFVFEQYKVSERDPAKLNLLRALGCAKSTFRLNKALDLVLDLYSGIETTAERLAVLQAVAGNSAGTNLAFNFIRNNFQTLVRRYGVGIVSSTISTLSNYLSDEFELDDLQRFIDANREALGPIADSSTYNINRNILWMKNNYAEFREFMSTNYP